MSNPSAEDRRRLLRDYPDATAQFKATDDVLSALGRSTSDADAVLGTVMESARRLCRSQAESIYLMKSFTFRLRNLQVLRHEALARPRYPTPGLVGTASQD
jgi:hypothetical protein